MLHCSIIHFSDRRRAVAGGAHCTEGALQPHPRGVSDSSLRWRLWSQTEIEPLSGAVPALEVQGAWVRRDGDLPTRYIDGALKFLA